MKFMRQTISLSLVLAILCGFFPIVALDVKAEETASESTTLEIVATGSCGTDATWTVYSDKSLVISGTGDVTSRPWSDGYSTVHSLVVKEGITGLCGHAFQNMASLKSVILPDSLLYIDDYCFAGDSNLTDISIPQNLIGLGDYAFAWCTSLTSFVIPDSVTSETNFSSVVEGCSNLKSLTLGKNVSLLSSINNSVTFEGLSSLEEYIVVPENPYFASIDGAIYSKNGKEFLRYPDGKAGSFTIENGVETINAYAFYYSTKVTDIYIPESVSDFSSNDYGSFLIWNASSLQNIHVSENNASFSSENGILYNKSKTLLLCCGPAKEGEIIIEDKIWEIGTRAFHNCKKITQVILPSSLEKIGFCAFEGCSNLENLVIPSTVIKWGQFAFKDCSGLKWIAFGVKNCSFNQDFDGCNSLRDVYYYGSANEWTTIEISSYDAPVKNATKHYNSALPGTWPVTYELNGGLNHSNNPTQYYNYDSDITLYSPSKEGCIFDGWYLDEQLAQKASAPQLVRGHTYGDQKFYAKWNKVEKPATSGTCGDNLTWEFEEETGVLTISGTGKMDSFSDSAPGAPWYAYREQIKTVIIQTGITNIGGCAFINCTNLTNVTIPNSVISIDDNAFNRCDSLANIVIPNSVIRIADAAFYHCISLTKITIPNSVTSLDAAFYDCKNLISVILPDKITYIDNNTFAHCSSLTNITIPDDVINIGDNAFYYCKSLSSIIIPDSVTSIGDYAFDNCTNLKSAIIGSGTNTIGSVAFSNCTELSEITFRNNAPTIEADAFSYVGATAYYPTNNPTWTSEVMKDYGGNLTWIGYDGESTYSGPCGDNLNWEYNIESSKLSVSGSGEMYGADQLGWTAFAGSIRSVEIGNGATSIGAYAFADCENLTDVQMPGSVIRIAYNAFENCSSLRAVAIPANVTEIAYGAFMDCSALTAVDIPDNVTEIAYSAFNGCTGLASVELPKNVMSISYRAFENCSSLSEVNFPASLASIQDEAFGSCTGLDALRFTGNAPEIRSNAFRSVTADAYYPAANTTWTEDVRQNYGGTLTWIAEGGSVTPDNSCGENITWQFEESTGTLTISGTEPMARSNGISIMDDYARPEDAPWFKYQDQIITIIIEGSVDSIGKNAFAGCSNLTTVIIEEGISEIDSTAFSDCDALENCYFEGSEEQWEDLGADIGEATVHTESAEPETHTEAKKTIAPTCTEQGYDLYTCSCGTIRKDNFTDPTGHTWDEGTVTKQPTETENGIRTYTCTVCKDTKTEDIPVLEHKHSYSAVVTDPTCTEKGYTTYTCSCGDTYTDNEVDALDHTWDEGTVTKQPTETENGIRTYTCTVCKDTKTEDIPYEAPATSPVRRIYGQDRIETALAVAAELKSVLKIDKFDAIILAAGGSGSDQTKFADALSGSYLATEKGAPILLYTKGNLSPKNLAFIEENLSDNGIIYLLGGNASIPEEVEEALVAEGYTTKRLGGANRYDTNLVILEETGIDEAKEILISSGRAFADSLSASATGLPIMLVNGTNTALTNAQVQFLKSVKDKKITILGGTAAVSEALEAAIEEAVGTDVERIFGAARESTSAMIAEKYFADADTALIAYSKMYPDGLAGGVLANALHAPLLLTKAGSESIAREYIEESDISSGYVLGGTAVLTDETARAVFGLSNDVTIITK